MELEQENWRSKREFLHYDLGTFEGFSFLQQCAIPKTLTAEEVVEWDETKPGEAEFWPAGDNRGISLIFKNKSAVTAVDLCVADVLLDALGGDSDENYLKIYYAVCVCGLAFASLNAAKIEEETLHIYFGNSFHEMRKKAAYELFEVYWPELYKMYGGSNCDGLLFDPRRFLDSPSFYTEELRFGKVGAALLVAPR
jgi:hypothetical protein